MLKIISILISLMFKNGLIDLLARYFWNTVCFFFSFLFCV